MSFLRCPHTLTDGPRAGEVCGRIYRKPHSGCEKHRPALERKTKRRHPDENARRRLANAKRKTLAGLPAGWEGA